MPTTSWTFSIRFLAAHGAFIILLLISLRHLAIDGDVLWTEEADVGSWHMRLRSKECTYEIASAPGQWQPMSFEGLTSGQRSAMSNPAALMVFLKQTRCSENEPVYARVDCSLHNSARAPMIDSQVNLCSAQYRYLTHNSWIRRESPN